MDLKKIGELDAATDLQDGYNGVVSTGPGAGDVKRFTFGLLRTWIAGLIATAIAGITQGPAGPQGSPGAAGAAGAAGAKGDKGDKGDQGIKGDVGPSGPVGIQGAKGDKGDKGDTGAQGVQGIKGDKGDTGNNGDNGQGVPAGGFTGQILQKTSDDDFDTSWSDNSFANLSGEPGDNISLDTALDAKVDKVAGKSLISDSEIARLAGVSNLFDGTYASLSALQAAVPASSPGHNAIVDLGAGHNAIIYIWDIDDGWVEGGGTGASNFADLGGSPSDNAALSAALAAKEPAITAGSTSQYLRGDKSLGTFLTDVMACLLTGISFSTSTAITSTDNLKAALGKLQAQISNIVANLIPTVASGEKVVTQKSNGTHVDYDAVTQYLADIDDSAGDKTSTDLNTAYPSALIGQRVWGVNNLYEKKTTLTWSKIPFTVA